MSLVRSAIRVLKQSYRFPSYWQVARSLTIDIDQIKDKETAEEAVFFSKQDEKLLRGLLKKIKHQADATDKSEAAEEAANELANLERIVNKYKISEADMHALILWKHGHHTS